jgi:tetratricopeptide (TPR) repeat protein
LEAAEAVCNGEGDLDLFEGIASLVDQSLLRQEGEEFPRFSMLETVREYATEKLQERGEVEETQAAHAAHFLQVAEEAEPEVTGPKQGDWLAQLDEEVDNLRGALGCFRDRGAMEKELRLAAALFWYWRPRGYWSEGRRWLEEGLAEGDRVVPGVRAKALWALGYIASLQGDSERATPLLDEALGLYRGLEDRRGSARALESLGMVALWQGLYERATALYEEGLRLSRDLGDWRESAWTLFTLGIVAWYQGDLVKAKERYEEALAISRAVGDAYTTAFTLTLWSHIALHEGNVAEAELLYEESLALAQEAGLKRVVAYALRGLGRVAQRQGQLERARERMRESLLLAREQGERYLILYQLGDMAGVAVSTREAERAARLKGAEMALRERLGVPLPPVYQAEGEETLAKARALLGEEAFTRAWELGWVMSLEEAAAYALGERE